MHIQTAISVAFDDTCRYQESKGDCYDQICLWRGPAREGVDLMKRKTKLGGNFLDARCFECFQPSPRRLIRSSHDMDLANIAVRFVSMINKRFEVFCTITIRATK